MKTEAAVAPVIPVKPVYTPEVSAVDTLMELLRESFKVRNAYIAVISYIIAMVVFYRLAVPLAS